MESINKMFRPIKVFGAESSVAIKKSNKKLSGAYFYSLSDMNSFFSQEINRCIALQDLHVYLKLC